MTNDLYGIFSDVSKRIMPLLHGLGPEMQGAVLADLTALWLAGYQGADADKVRARILKAHVKAIRELIPVNDSMVRDAIARQRKQ